MKLRKPINNFTEETIIRRASEVCSLSPKNILLIGGGMILPEISGYKRLRGRSDDIDFVANEEGLEALLSIGGLRAGTELIARAEENCWYRKTPEGLTLGFFVSSLRGYAIPTEIFLFSEFVDTSFGPVRTVPPEFNLAMKIRRGASKGRIYTKDALDTSTMIVGRDVKGIPFDISRWTNYMGSVCLDCTLSDSYGCVDGLSQGILNLDIRKRNLVTSSLENMRQSVSCRRYLVKSLHYEAYPAASCGGKPTNR